MSLLGAQGGRTSVIQKSIKQSLLNEQIAKLRKIYQQCSEASEKVLKTLKNAPDRYHSKDIAKRTVQEVQIFNKFLEDLSSIEDSLITLIENAESDKELFISTIIFRDSQKSIAAQFFRATLKNYEDFKEKLNGSIHRLQKDIQNLQTNGYHIYDINPKPNNVTASLKKQNLQKYMVCLVQMQKVFEKMRKEMFSEIKMEKKPVKEQYKNDIQKFKQCYKNAEKISLKEKMTNALLIDEITKIRGKIDMESSRMGAFEQSLKIMKKQIQEAKNESGFLQNQGQSGFGYAKKHLKTLKQKIDASMIWTPSLYKQPSWRSKSCHTIITTEKKGRIQCDFWEEHPSESMSYIIGSNFLEESIQN